MELTKLQPTY